MAKNSIDAYGASGKTNVLMFCPEALTLVSDPKHPLYDERIHLPLDEAMVANIDDQGVLEPIIIWKDPESGLVCVVDGRQRVRHTLEANARRLARGADQLLIPAVIRRGSPFRMSQAMVSANEIRRPDTPLGRAKKMAAQLEGGADEKDLALTFGCSVETVRATLALLESPAVVRDAVEAGQITVTQARQLSKLKPDEQREKVRELVKAGEGAKPHERARRQREVLGSSKPRMRGRREIEARLTETDGPFADALRWVLGIGTTQDADTPQPEAA